MLPLVVIGVTVILLDWEIVQVVTFSLDSQISFARLRALILLTSERAILSRCS